MIRFLVFSLLCFVTQMLSAQQKKFLQQELPKSVIEVNGQFGTIFKHSSKFLPNITEYTYNLEASFSVRTFGTKAWQRKLHYPEIGVSLLHSQFGDDEIFGHGTGVFPHVKYFMKRTKVADMYFRVGTGLAYINKNYHPVNNPANNVIGAKLNNITQLRFGADFHINPHLDAIFALNFTHFSNARVQSPNLGINIPGIVGGIRFSPSKQLLPYNADSIPPPFKRNEYMYRFGVGINDNGIGGPKYPIYIHSIQYGRYTSVANKVIMGISFATNLGEYDFLQIQELSADKNQYLRASDLSVYLGDEILLGNVGINFLVGVYLMDKELNNAPVYAKLGVNYYFLEFAKQRHKLFLGVNLKSHYSVAEFVEMSAGIAF